MTRRESTAEVCDLLPTLTNEEAEQLAAARDDHPLLIRYVCVDFLNQDRPVGEFCSGILASPRGVTDGLYTEDGSRLTEVIRRLTKLIRTRDQLAYELLIA
jgi:hypothetical protein